MKLHRVAAIATTALVSVAGAFSVRSVLAQSNNDARIRVAHFSPDAPAIDIYVDGKKRLTNVPYEGVSDYLSLALGSHTFEVRATGTTPDSPAAFKTTADLEASSAYTVAAVGKIAKLEGRVYRDNLTPPGAGKAKVRILHAAPEIGPVDGAVKNGQVLFPKLVFPNASPYAEVTAGTYDLEARKAGSKDTILQAAVPLEPGSIYTIAAIGGGAQPARLKLIRDLDGGQILPPVTATPVPTRARPSTSVFITTPDSSAPVATAVGSTKARESTAAASGGSGSSGASAANGSNGSNGSTQPRETSLSPGGASSTTTNASTTLVTTTLAPTTSSAPTTVAPTTTKRSTTTLATTTTVAPTTTKRPTTTLSPTSTSAPTTTRSAPTIAPAATVATTKVVSTSQSTLAASIDTEPSVPDTQPGGTQPADTTATSVVATRPGGNVPPPKGAVGTGAGGLADPKTMMPIVLLGLFAFGAVGVGASQRRRLARR